MAEQRTDKWFADRLGKATASKFNDIMSRTTSGMESAYRKNYRAQLAIERITGVRQETYTSKEMEWGIEQEPVAREALEAETGYIVNEAPFYEHPSLEAGASPDGIIAAGLTDDGNGVLEIKCPNSATHIQTLMSRKVPRQYYAQIQGQMWITGLRWGKFVSFDPRLPLNAQLIIIHVPRDDSYIDDLAREVEDFLGEVEEYIEKIVAFDKDEINTGVTVKRKVVAGPILIKEGESEPRYGHK